MRKQTTIDQKDHNRYWTFKPFDRHLHIQERRSDPTMVSKFYAEIQFNRNVLADPAKNCIPWAQITIQQKTKKK